MSEPFFSIIVPVFKTEKYLDQCIQSILMQDMDDYELILVDDGSPDNCPAICDAYSSSHPFIRTIHQKNGGLSAARNSGLDVARGKYILFVDSDDFYSCDDALTALKQRLEKDSCDVLVFGMKKYMQLSDEYTGEKIPKCDEAALSHAEAMKYMMEHHIFMASAWDKALRREWLQKHYMRFIPRQLSEDIEWCGRLLLARPKISALSKSIYVYRKQNTESISSNITRANLKCIADVISKHTETKDNELLLHYYAEQYVLWLAISNLVPEADIKDLLVSMKSRLWLLKYSNYPRVKKIRLIRFLGFAFVRRALGYALQLKRQISKTHHSAASCPA